MEYRNIHAYEYDNTKTPTKAKDRLTAQDSQFFGNYIEYNAGNWNNHHSVFIAPSE
jgi:hypothetical protein